MLSKHKQVRMANPINWKRGHPTPTNRQPYVAWYNRLMVTERISLEGHLLDENTLAKLLTVLDGHGVAFEIKRFRVGENASLPSLIELVVNAPTQDSMNLALEDCERFGALFSFDEVELATADMDGVLPEEFYSTTNFTTFVRMRGNSIEVEKLEMDCGIRVWKNESELWRAETCPMHAVQKGDRLVIGYKGVKVMPDADDGQTEDEFRFMSSEVSSERPKTRMIAHCASAIHSAKAEGKKVLVVGGPAIIHSGCADDLAALIDAGWIDVLFAGNALAAHDIEASMLGTSLGVDLALGRSLPHGHTNHLRAINRVRRCGSIESAVREGLITGGVMKACLEKPIPFVLCGSIRDDGPLPEVITDVLASQDAMRALIPGVGVALMVATTLHSVATGNILPAHVRTYCVDNDADSVIKLTDRGTRQAIGIVTDCEFFMKELRRQLST